MTVPAGELRTFSGVPLVFTNAVSAPSPTGVPGSGVGVGGVVPVTDNQSLDTQVLFVRSAQLPLFRPVNSTRAPLAKVPTTAPPGELRTLSGVPFVRTKAVVTGEPTGGADRGGVPPVVEIQLLDTQVPLVRSVHSPRLRPVSSIWVPLGRLPMTEPPGELRTFRGVPLVRIKAVLAELPRPWGAGAGCAWALGAGLGAGLAAGLGVGCP